MRWLVCGGRDCADRANVYRRLDDALAYDPDLVLACGYNPNDKKYQGADQLAYEWAKDRGVPGSAYPAHWRQFGDSAGPRRNERMLSNFRPDHVMAFKGGKGTAHMTRIAREAGVHVIDVAD